MTVEQPTLPSPKVYNEFIAGIELVGVRMAAGSFNATVARLKVSQTDVRLETKHSYENVEDGFDARISFRVTFTTKKTEDPAGTVIAEYVLTYESPRSMDDEIWRVFADRNLRMNAWPYGREFVESTTLRMGWPRFTLPVINSARISKPPATTDDAVRSSPLE